MLKMLLQVSDNMEYTAAVEHLCVLTQQLMLFKIKVGTVCVYPTFLCFSLLKPPIYSTM